ncbi:MAG: hypothetical protein ACXWV8_13400 [Chitinophagaceae bacterium]
MEKLRFILPALFLSLALNAQQTEDEVYIGKGKTFGNYKETAIIIPDTDRKAKPINGQTAITGIVVTVGWCEEDCLTILVKKDDGTTVTVGTRDNGFTVPKKIVGRKIIVEGIDAGQISGGRKRRDMKKDAQQDIQFAATGLKIID